MNTAWTARVTQPGQTLRGGWKPIEGGYMISTADMQGNPDERKKQLLEAAALVDNNKILCATSKTGEPGSEAFTIKVTGAAAIKLAPMITPGPAGVSDGPALPHADKWMLCMPSASRACIAWSIPTHPSILPPRAQAEIEAFLKANHIHCDLVQQGAHLEVRNAKDVQTMSEMWKRAYAAASPKDTLTWTTKPIEHIGNGWQQDAAGNYQLSFQDMPGVRAHQKSTLAWDIESKLRGWGITPHLSTDTLTGIPNILTVSAARGDADQLAILLAMQLSQSPELPGRPT